MRDGIVWSYAPRNGRFSVRLVIAQDYGYRYDGDHPEGETQAALDRGDYVAFSSCVEVLRNGVVIAGDWLGGSVYEASAVSEFWTAHRDPNQLNRNCSLMRAARGSNVVFCHYFPDMVSRAIEMAREEMARDE